MEKLRIVGGAILEQPASEFFTLDQVIEITGLDRAGIRRALERLSREKIVVKIEKKPGYIKVENAYPYPEAKGRPPLAITYRVKDRGKLTGRVAPKLKENTAQDKMWSVIRNKSRHDGSFTVRDVITLAEVKFENARWYIKMLRRGGIVQASGKCGHGTSWTLIKDPGPRRPYVQKHAERIAHSEKRREI
jgi:hypothetical protein